VNVVQSQRSIPRRARTRPRRSTTRTRRANKSADERRKDILDAALQLFARRGFSETTVGDIAAEAGMATGTVYLYFPSKEHVLLGLHQRFRDENEATVTAAAVDAVDRATRGEPVDYRDTIDAILDAVAASFRENRDLVVVCTKYRPELVDPAYNPSSEHFGIVARALEAGVELGMIHTSDPAMTAYLMDAAIAFNLHAHITYGDPPDLDRLVAAAKEMFHKALELPAGAKPPARRAASPARGAGSPARGAGSPARRRVR
jgi:AcrR family transcriptional regulator